MSRTKRKSGKKRPAIVGLTAEQQNARTPGAQRRITRATMKIPVVPYLNATPEHERRFKKRQEADTESKKCKPGTCPACDLVTALWDVQRDIAYMMNLTVRRAWQADGTIIDDFRLKHQRAPKPSKGEVTFEPENYYQLARRAVPSISAAITASAVNTAANKWRQVRLKALLHMDERPPHFKSDNTPIPIRAADAVVLREKERDRFSLLISLRSKEYRKTEHVGKEFRVPLQTKDTKQYRILKEISEGETCKMGALQLQRDRRNRWSLRVAYKRVVPVLPEVEAAAINRGIVCFLALVSSDESDGKRVYDGHDIEQHLRNTQARRRQIQRDWAMSRRKGRGRRRALKPAYALMGKSERWRDTKNQTIAREVIQWCLERGKTVLYIEDFKGIRDGRHELLEGGYSVWKRIQEWRFFDLQTRLISCAEEAGMHVYIVPCQKISKTCPQCDAIDNKRKPARTFKCPACGYKRHSDEAAARVLLKRGISMRAEGKLQRKTRTVQDDLDDAERKAKRDEEAAAKKHRSAKKAN